MFVLLVLVGAQVRVWLQDLPNFAPVAALALFAGYYFRSWALAVAVPLSVMALSDWQIGGYDWRMMAVVYGMLAAPVALRTVLRRHLSLKQGPLTDAMRAVTGLVTCSLGAACLFFVVTNFASWLWFGGYERSWSGLMACYTMALPFFRYTLAGDLSFALVLFGGYALATQMGWANRTSLAADA
jgi:hypothetical protein